MNIFFLDRNPQKAANMLLWKRHIVKMPTETAQIMSDACHQLGVSGGDFLYKPPGGNPNPTKWLMQSQENLIWLGKYAEELLNLYTDIYGKTHKAGKVIQVAHDLLLPLLPKDDFILPHEVVPDGWKATDPFSGFRSYYLSEKVPLIEPVWFNQNAVQFWTEAHQARIRITIK